MHTRRARTKLLILQTHPIQYYAPLYRALSEREGLDVCVVYLSDGGPAGHQDAGFGIDIQWDIPLLDGYRYRVLSPGSPIKSWRFSRLHSPLLHRCLEEELPDWILLYGYNSRMNWSALCWAIRHKVHLAYTSDSNARLQRSGWKQWIKLLLLRPYFGSVRLFFSPSDANREYLEKFGVDARKIVWSPFAIDVKRFRQAECSHAERRVHFVWAGKFIDLKRPLDFVHALSRLVERGYVHVRALMIGTGPSFDRVRNVARELLAAEVITFAGFVNQSAMPAHLKSGPVFVFTSERDQYGLAVTEAAACGAALIVADINGCVGQTGSAQDSVNACIYRTGNVEELTNCMESLLIDQGKLTAMQRASVEIADKHDVSHAARIIDLALTTSS